MADSLFPQYPAVEQTSNPAPEQQSTIAGRWNDWLADPANRASLMQLGVNLMQPIGVGQSVGGHVGQALGASAEAGTRSREATAADAERTAKEARAKKAQELEATDVATRRIAATRTGAVNPYQQAKLGADEAKAFRKFLTDAAGASVVGDTDATKALAGDEAALQKMLQVYRQTQNPAGSEGVAPSGAGGMTIETDPQTGRKFYKQNGVPIGWVLGDGES